VSGRVRRRRIRPVVRRRTASPKRRAGPRRRSRTGTRRAAPVAPEAEQVAVRPLRVQPGDHRPRRLVRQPDLADRVPPQVVEHRPQRHARAVDGLDEAPPPEHRGAGGRRLHVARADARRRQDAVVGPRQDPGQGLESRRPPGPAGQFPVRAGVGRARDLQADELGPPRGGFLALFVQPVGEDQAGRVLVGVREDGLQERFAGGGHDLGSFGGTRETPNCTLMPTGRYEKPLTRAATIRAPLGT
jgi:hypothetical protein